MKSQKISVCILKVLLILIDRSFSMTTKEFSSAEIDDSICMSDLCHIHNYELSLCPNLLVTFCGYDIANQINKQIIAEKEVMRDRLWKQFFDKINGLQGRALKTMDKIMKAIFSCNKTVMDCGIWKQYYVRIYEAMFNYDEIHQRVDFSELFEFMNENCFEAEYL